MNDPVSFTEYLQTHDTLTYTNVGVSMLPLLRQGKDLFIVRKKEKDRCKKGDVALYRRGDAYVLHRIIEVRPENYVILGDNCIAKEYGVRDEEILGVMTGYVRNGKEHSIHEWRYRLYSFVILHSVGLRFFLKHCKKVLTRCVKGARHAE